MGRVLPLRWSAVLLALCALAGCSPPTHPEPLTIGMSPWPGYELLYVAEARGYLRDEGVEVRFIDYPSLSDAREAFEWGQLDGFASTLIEVLQVRHSVDREPVIALVTDYSDGPDVVLARADVRNVAGLRGRRVGVELESVSLYLLARALQSADMSFHDVQIVGLPQGRMRRAVEQGAVDVVVTYPPVAYEIEQIQGMREVFSSRDVPRELVDVVSFERGVFEQRREELDALRRAWHRAVTYYRTDPSGTIAIIAAREHSPPADTARAMAGLQLIDGMRQLVFLGDASERSPVGNLLLNLEATMMQAGMLKGAPRGVCCLAHTAPPQAPVAASAAVPRASAKSVVPARDDPAPRELPPGDPRAGTASTGGTMVDRRQASAQPMLRRATARLPPD